MSLRIRKKAWLWLLLLAALLGDRPAEAAGPAAMVTDVKGSVEVLLEGKWKRAQLLQQLPEGAKMKVPKGATTTLSFFADGTRVAVTGPSQVQLAASGVKVLEGGAGAARVQAARRTASGTTMKPAGVTMGAEFHRNVDDLRVLTLGGFLARPELTWDGHPDATAYEIQVLDPNGAVVWKGKTAETRAAIPADTVLVPGTRYETVVKAWDEALKLQVGDSATGTFWILPDDTRQDMEALREAAEEELKTSPQDPTPLLIVASQYYGVGLYTDALTLAQRVKEKRPEDPGIYAFLTNIYSQLKRYPEAGEAYKRSQ